VWLRSDLLYTDLDDDLNDLLAEIGSQVDIAAITETYQQELTPIEIHDESVEDLHTACLGPRYSDAYEEAEEGGDTATCARLEREQAQFAERLYEAWAVEVVRIGAEHGYEVKPVDGNDSVFPPQSRTESSGFTQGRTVEDFIHDAAHDAVAIDDL